MCGPCTSPTGGFAVLSNRKSGLSAPFTARCFSHGSRAHRLPYTDRAPVLAQVPSILASSGRTDIYPTAHTHDLDSM